MNKMKIISILNIKGGVAKTVSAVNIAAELGRLGNSVLIIDLDPQANATKYLDCYQADGLSTYDVLNGADVGAIYTGYDGVYLIPSNIKLILSESEILADTKRSRELRLRKYLNKINVNYDYVIIDCPPSLGVLTTNALAASDYVMVPIKIDMFALDGFEYLISSIEEIREEFNPELNLLGVFITMDKSTTINREIKEELRESLGDKLFKTTIRDNVDVVKSTFNLKPVIYFNKKAAATKDYKALVKEIEEWLI